MIFIVESGSTKSDWVLLDDKNNQSFYSTMGFNPYFHSADLIESELKKNSPMMLVAYEVTQVFFYGAGCSSDKMNAIVEEGLTRVFSNAKIHVDHDLVACAYATYLGRPAISCIIGTGSNSCYFDGENLIEKTPSLGYILGDEGSGASMGKSLLSQFLYHKLPHYLELHFKEKLHLTKELILENVYKKPNSNSYLASFTKELYQFRKEPWVIQFISEHFNSFLKTHVVCFQNATYYDYNML